MGGCTGRKILSGLFNGKPSGRAARYCMECASPLTPEGVEEFQKIEEFLKNNPSAKHLLKKMSETTMREE